MSAHDGSRWIGRVLRDKWRLDERIARGGVGTVWAATHRKNGNHVAIKILHPEFSRDPDTRSRFLQEGYAANRVNHPGVVRILDDDVTEEGQAFLVMELLEGELLEQRRKRKGGRLPVSEIFEIGDQLLDVLAAAHAQGIIHRDIKPDNLFLTKQGRLKVLDFGFAQMKSGFRKEQTLTGFLLGTPGFMSPEQAVGNRALVDDRTDIWAVGATLYTLLTGRNVHEGDSAAELLVAAANYQARPLLSVEPNAPPALAHVIDRAVAFEKSERWANARQMQAALRAATAARTPMPSFLPTGEHGVPQVHDSVQGEKTVMETFEQVDERDLEDAHPADEEPITAAPQTSPMPARPSAGNVIAADGGTMIMAPSGKQATVPPRFGTSTLAMQGAPQPFGVRPPAPSRPDELPFVAGPARPPPREAKGLRRYLVFVGVGLFSMTVVIVTGLLVLAATE